MSSHSYSANGLAVQHDTLLADACNYLLLITHWSAIHSLKNVCKLKGCNSILYYFDETSFAYIYLTTFLCLGHYNLTFLCFMLYSFHMFLWIFLLLDYVLTNDTCSHRNRKRSRFLGYILIFYFGIMQGSWIVRQSVGSTPCLLGKAVDCNYIRGPKYLEVRTLFLMHINMYMHTCFYTIMHRCHLLILLGKIWADDYARSCLTKTVLFVDWCGHWFFNCC